MHHNHVSGTQFVVKLCAACQRYERGLHGIVCALGARDRSVCRVRSGVYRSGGRCCTVEGGRTRGRRVKWLRRVCVGSFVQVVVDVVGVVVLVIGKHDADGSHILDPRNAHHVPQAKAGACRSNTSV